MNIFVVIMMIMTLGFGLSFMSLISSELVENNRNIDKLTVNQKALNDTVTDLNYEIAYRSVIFKESDRLLMSPTINHVEAFLKKDKTNRNNYTAVEYDCTQFSMDTVRNAMKQGIYACVVSITYEDNETKDRTGHSIIAFNTSDFGVIYFEPQADGIVNLKLGENFNCLNYNECDSNKTIIGWYSCFGGEAMKIEEDD